jgi:hypothetical protein
MTTYRRACVHAKYKGVGLMNGEDEYKFILTTTDGAR